MLGIALGALQSERQTAIQRRNEAVQCSYQFSEHRNLYDVQRAGQWGRVGYHRHRSGRMFRDSSVARVSGREGRLYAMRPGTPGTAFPGGGYQLPVGGCRELLRSNGGCAGCGGAGSEHYCRVV